MAKKKSKSKSKLPSSLTTVTPFSKMVALALFILLPFLAFCLGMKYQRNLDILANPTVTPVVIKAL